MIDSESTKIENQRSLTLSIIFEPTDERGNGTQRRKLKKGTVLKTNGELAFDRFRKYEKRNEKRLI